MSEKEQEERPTEKDLEALYNINKHAAKYSERASKRYSEDNGATAKWNSLRKEALYSLKSKVLDEIKEESDTVGKHEIDGNLFWHFGFENWSFHAPIEDIDGIDDAVTSVEEIEDFEKESEKEHSDMYLKDALKHIKDVYGINANDELPKKYVTYVWKEYFVGWKYLD